MPKLVLTYFTVRARAEALRMILAHGKVEYEFVSTGGAAYGKAKSEGAFPFDQLPVMDIDGERLGQSGALSRYCAKLAGLYPSDPLAALRADEIFEMGQEMSEMNPIVNIFTGELFETKKAEYMGGFPKKAQALVKRLGEKKFFCGDEVTYGDFSVYHVLDMVLLLDEKALVDFPTLVAWMGRVAELSGVKEYLQTRARVVGVGTAPRTE
mmetsp:Transcript_10457/g.8060  ORF Transcript_10457/g.8060 Transcript_10457/m.8060 type:complete len:210 (-) Transcript_10457:155-784(-)